MMRRIKMLVAAAVAMAAMMAFSVPAFTQVLSPSKASPNASCVGEFITNPTFVTPPVATNPDTGFQDIIGHQISGFARNPGSLDGFTTPGRLPSTVARFPHSGPTGCAEQLTF